MKYCPVYMKIFQALETTEPNLRHYISNTVCREAGKYKIPSRLSAKEIVAAVRMKQSKYPKSVYVPEGVRTNPQRGDNTPPGYPGVKDKKYDVSTYPDKASCIQGLVSDQNLSLAVATQECERQFGPGEEQAPLSGKERQAILNRIRMDYPSISPSSAKVICDNAILEATRKANIENSKKTISPLQANSRHIYAASLDAEIPSYLYIEGVKSGKLDPSDNITLKPAEVKTTKKIRSAASIEPQKMSDLPAFIVTNPNIVERNAIIAARQEANKHIEKKSPIKNAATKTKNNDHLKTLHDNYEKGTSS
jgi:hypothetical protein